VYEDLGEVNIDPVANERYNRGFQLNWGVLVVNAHELIDILSYFLLLFPMTFLTSQIVEYTNFNLREARKPITDKAEMLRFLGITLAMSLDPVRGGLKSYWDDNDVIEESIYQKKCYGSRFLMTRHRFQDIRIENIYQWAQSQLIK